ncbi:S8 family peptidase [bacterium]|nr:S8 family peptidase [bacterium]RQV95871.1 MAG: T9SS C-terminal target domain-containing protein [bacterium]
MRHSRTIVRYGILFYLMGSLFLQAGQIQDDQKYWVFFKDKGENGVLQKNGFEAGLTLNISQRALMRRAKVQNEEKLIDFFDLPVSAQYIQQLEVVGLECRVVSRWLNGVSVVIPQEILEEVRSLPFVSRVQSVNYLYDIPLSQAFEKIDESFPVEPPLLDYGQSYTQNQLIHIPEVHNRGITGKGVLVGIIDTGFDYQGRTVFSHIDVLDEYDFHWNDHLTANEDGYDPRNQHDHGTEVLSILGGFHEGYLIGPAYGATFALAKTEWLPTETRIEEDHWVAAIEWLENLGADVVSSSVGYGEFDDGSGYTYADLDGNTCVTTIAADIAASKGVVVVNAAGNRDFSDFINSPADGDSVIAVGSVSSNGILAYNSSLGPTADGRTKPDVVAMGVGVIAVSPSRHLQSYLSVSGTSAACPLVAGVCALVLQAHPELGSMDVRDAIRETASQSDSQDTEKGWGLVNAYEAIFYHGMIFMNFEKVTLPVENQIGIDVDIVSKSGIVPDSVFIFYQDEESEDFQKKSLFKVYGGNVQTYRALLPPSIDIDHLRFYLSAVDAEGVTHFGPRGAPGLLYSFEDTSSYVVVGSETPEAFALYQNYPNPFNEETIIVFDLSQRSKVTITIYNMVGQEVITLTDGLLGPGKKEIRWKARDSFGNKVASGLYFYRMQVGEFHDVRKMILVN